MVRWMMVVGASLFGGMACLGRHDVEVGYLTQRADSVGERLSDRQVDDEFALQTEVVYVRAGDLHIAGIPGELYPELVYGGYQSPVEPNADFPTGPTEPPVIAYGWA